MDYNNQNSNQQPAEGQYSNTYSQQTTGQYVAGSQQGSYGSLFEALMGSGSSGGSSSSSSYSGRSRSGGGGYTSRSGGGGYSGGGRGGGGR